MREKNIRWFLMTAALFAVLVRALIPQGYMPDIKTHQMVICTAEGVQTVDMSGKFDPLQKHVVEKKCDFSLTTVNGAAIVLANTVLEVLAFVAVIAMAVQCLLLSRRFSYSVSAPRAPPVTV